MIWKKVSMLFDKQLPEYLYQDNSHSSDNFIRERKFYAVWQYN